jgi:hypothetical protein
MKGGGDTGNDAGCAARDETRIAELLQGGERLGLSCNFFFRAWALSHLVESDCASRFCL